MSHNKLSAFLNFPIRQGNAPLRRPSVAVGAAKEIRICVNKVCKKQGSQQIVNVLKDLELEAVEVATCGCLGECGRGPNVALLPRGDIHSGIATPAQAFKMLRECAGIDVDERDIKAIQLRMEGNDLAMQGKTREAWAKYAEAIASSPPHGLYKLYSNLSLAALTCGDIRSAQEAALKAIDSAPVDYTTAKIRAIEAYMADNKLADARSWLMRAIKTDPSFKNTPIYKNLSMALYG